jgi:polyhydroxybutyrate depolymerase
MKILFFLLISFSSLAATIAVDARKPAIVNLPIDLAEKSKWPLVISIHGFLSNPKIQGKIFPADKFVDKKGFILITPFGLRNAVGIRYWNASDKCCDLFNQNPDDITYLKKLINKAKEEFPIDAEKIFLVGHSNGGFLAYRFACEAAEYISGIVSIAGVNSFGEINCKPSRPISILQIHGKNDRIIKYNGNSRRGFPSALESIIPWSKINKCGKKQTTDMLVNFSGCDQGKSVQLWTLNDHNHNKSLGNKLTSEVLNYLF